MIHYQYAHALTTSWTVGQEDFEAMWENASDGLRFHKGNGFVIIANKDEGPKRRLWEIPDHLKAQLNTANVDEVVRVKALSDNFALMFRRHEVADPKSQQLIDVIAAKEGAPYVFGGLDCSGLVAGAVQAVTGILLPHNANAMRSDPRFKTIARSEAKMGDFAFIDRDSAGYEHHIATVLDLSNPRYPGGSDRLGHRALQHHLSDRLAAPLPRDGGKDPARVRPLVLREHLEFRTPRGDKRLRVCGRQTHAHHRAIGDRGLGAVVRCRHLPAGV